MTDIQYLQEQIRALRERVATLEANSHPPADLGPAVATLVGQGFDHAAKSLECLNIRLSAVEARLAHISTAFPPIV